MLILRQLANEREKLLRAYYTDAIDVENFKREQARISAEVAQAEAQLATDGESLKQAKEIIDLAFGLAKNCAASYRRAQREVRKMWNQAFFRKVLVSDGRVSDHVYEAPFASLLGSHKTQIVEVGSLELHFVLLRHPRSEGCRWSELQFRRTSSVRSCPLLSAAHLSAADPARTDGVPSVMDTSGAPVVRDQEPICRLRVPLACTAHHVSQWRWHALGKGYVPRS